MTQDLVPMESQEVVLAGLPPAPKQVIAMAKEQAEALMDVVKTKGLYVTISKKQYLTAEAWETIGAFNMVHAESEYVSPVKDDEGVTFGYEAKINLIKNGQIVGSGIAVCGFDEGVCQRKTGTAKIRACQSAAQTWATSKAYRLNYSWVVVLAGFEPTPAEEMQSEPFAPPESPKHTKHAPTANGSLQTTMDDVTGPPFENRGQFMAWARSKGHLQNDVKRILDIEDTGTLDFQDQETIKKIQEAEAKV